MDRSAADARRALRGRDRVTASAWGSSTRQRLRLWPLYAAVQAGGALGRITRPPRRAFATAWAPGVSIVVP